MGSAAVQKKHTHKKRERDTQVTAHEQSTKGRGGECTRKERVNTDGYKWGALHDDAYRRRRG